MHNRLARFFRGVQPRIAPSFRPVRQHFSNQRQIKPENSFKDFFRYTEKFPTLMEPLKTLSLKTAGVSDLRQAIQTGNEDADVFSDPQCHLYLLYLIRKQKIPYWQGITVYVYLMALMQFTNKQLLNRDDRRLRCHTDPECNFKVLHLSRAGKLTAAGECYLQSIIQRFEIIDVDIDYAEIKNYILQLSPTENWLLQSAYNSVGWNIGNYHQLTTILCKNIPLLGIDDKQYNTFLTPSLTLVRFILEKMNPDPMQMQPVFGLITKTHFDNLHAANKHPVSLYLPGTYRNLIAPHDFLCGPFTTYLHDVGHALWGSMLDAEDKHKLFNYFIPQLQLLSRESKKYLRVLNQSHKPEIAAAISARIEGALLRAHDLDLTEIHAYKYRETRYVRYIARTLGEYEDNLLYHLNFGSHPRQIIGNCMEDHLYFLLEKLSYHPQFSAVEKHHWLRYLQYLREQFKPDFRMTSVINALQTLARLSTRADDATLAVGSRILNWAAWQEIIDANHSSEKLWRLVTQTRHDELLILINDYQLAFFHPYLPMTSVKMASLKKLVAEKIQAQTADLDKPEYEGYRRKPF